MTIAVHTPPETQLSQLPSRRITREEYARLPEGPPYYELIDGELVEMSPRALTGHSALQAYLFEVLGPHARGLLKGRLFVEPNLYLPGTENVYQPDLVYVSRPRLSIQRRDGIYGAPDLVCEILSPSTASRDRYIKLEAYCQAGIPHYWLFDPEAVAVEEFVLAEDGRYRVQATATPPAIWSPLAFPGWSLDLGATQAALADPPAEETEEATEEELL
jgi:Uma2 family endonuclease